MATLLGDEVMDISEYAKVLEAGFEAAKVGVIPGGYDCVMIGDIERTRLDDIKYCLSWESMMVLCQNPIIVAASFPSWKEKNLRKSYGTGSYSKGTCFYPAFLPLSCSDKAIEKTLSYLCKGRQ